VMWEHMKALRDFLATEPAGAPGPR